MSADYLRRSVFYSTHLREYFSTKIPNKTCCKCHLVYNVLAKILPDIGVENFECLQSQAFHLHSMLEPNSPPFACDFSPALTDLILIAQEDGLVHLYDTSVSGPTSLIRHYEPHANAIFDVKWLSSGDSFLTASGDQSVRLVNAETGTTVQQFFGHTMSVRSLSLMPNDTQIFASASRDGGIRLWDIRVKPDTVNFRGSPGTSSVGVISQCHIPNWSNPESLTLTGRRTRSHRRTPTDAQSVTSVLFMDDNTLLSAGSTDGAIKMWDLRRIFSVGNKKQAKPKFVLHYRGVSQKQSGYSDLVLNSYRTRLYANCLDNVVYEYDLTKTTSTKPVFIYTGHVTDSFYVKLDISPDDSFIVCGSSDRRAHIYAVGRSRQRPVVLSGHTGEVSVPRWCKGDPSRIVTLSDDTQAFVWNMFPARKYIMPEPKELAGLAELLSPSRSIMSPSEQERRVLQSPHSSLTKGKRNSPLLVRSPLTSARRRQSNIRHFLEAISPPLNFVPNPTNCNNNKSALTTSSATATSTNSNAPIQIKRIHTLSETLGGVVQRFPGSAFGLMNNTSYTAFGTPPLGCYSSTCAILAELSSKTDSPVGFDRSLVDQDDCENIDPNGMHPILVAHGTDFVDGRILPNSPNVRFSTDKINFGSLDTPITPTYKRSQHVHQLLFNTPPQMTSEDAGFTSRKRPRADYTNMSPTSSPALPLNDIDTPIKVDYFARNKDKKRRVTVLGMHSPSSALSKSPSTPTRLRARRMTANSPSMLNPITKYFKRFE